VQIKVELLESLGSDEGVAHATWTSSGKNKNRSAEDIKNLLEKIIREGHDSCLEHVVFRFRIEAPLYIMQQITRHRIGCSFNMASGRYQYPFTDFLRVPDELLGEINTIDFEEYNQICGQALNFYKRISEKYKKNKRVTEILRGALPTATMSLVMTINLRAWLNFYNQRADEHAQFEIQEIANQMKELISKIDAIKTIFFNLEMRGRM
jgi:thymidylate synthase (FAD)